MLEEVSVKADIRTENIAIEARGSGKVRLTEFSAFRGSPWKRSAKEPREVTSESILENQGEFNGQLRF